MLSAERSRCKSVTYFAQENLHPMGSQIRLQHFHWSPAAKLSERLFKPALGLFLFAKGLQRNGIDSGEARGRCGIFFQQTALGLDPLVSLRGPCQHLYFAVGLRDQHTVGDAQEEPVADHSRHVRQLAVDAPGVKRRIDVAIDNQIAIVRDHL